MRLRGQFGPVLVYLWGFGGHFDLFGPILSLFRVCFGLFWGLWRPVLAYFGGCGGHLGPVWPDPEPILAYFGMFWPTSGILEAT